MKAYGQVWLGRLVVSSLFLTACASGPPVFEPSGQAPTPDVGHLVSVDEGAPPRQYINPNPPAVSQGRMTLEAVKRALQLGHPLRGQDMSELNLAGLNFRDADLRDARLSQAFLGAATLHRADLRRADLTDASLVGADLSDARLAEANLTGADLTMVRLGGANLCGALLRGAKMRKVSLSRVDLRDADVDGAEFIEVNLRDAQNLHLLKNRDTVRGLSEEVTLHTRRDEALH